MITIKEQEKVREFSLSEVCNVITVIMCFNETGGLDENGRLVQLDTKIKQAMCVKHTIEKINDLVEHIETIGICKLVEHTKLGVY